MDLRW
jgi:hypothetical protein